MNFNRIPLALGVLGSVFFILTGCQSKTSSSTDTTTPDTVAIKKGQAIFSQQCAACHNFSQDGIGPQLGGITAAVPIEWIENFIKDPKTMIESGDERSHQLFEKFKTIMPSFATFSDEDLHGVVSFLGTKKAADPKKTKFDPNALTNPIPEPIAMSDLAIGLELITTIPPSSTEGQLTRICKLDFRPDTKELFVVDLRGKLYKLENNKPLLYLDMVKEKPKFIHKPGLATGFGSFAFHPNFQKNGLL